MAGYSTPSGLQFRYYDSLGTRLTTIAQRLSLSRIDVYTRAEGGTAAVTERKVALMGIVVISISVPGAFLTSTQESRGGRNLPGVMPVGAGDSSRVYAAAATRRGCGSRA